MVSVGGIPCPLVDLARVEPEKEDSARVELEREDLARVEPQREDSAVGEPEVERNGPEGGRTQALGESRYREVYVRRNKQSEGAVPTVPSPLSLPTPNPKTITPSTSDAEYTGAMIPLSTSPTPLSVRMTPRENAGIPSDRYDFLHKIAQFVSYSHISPVHRAFIVSLDTVSISKYWQGAKEDPKWEVAMLEELGALDKNKTWEIVSLSPDKKAVGCKWIFTVKQSSEGKVERYKA